MDDLWQNDVSDEVSDVQTIEGKVASLLKKNIKDKQVLKSEIIKYLDSTSTERFVSKLNYPYAILRE
jgi:hypothetical protein